MTAKTWLRYWLYFLFPLLLILLVMVLFLARSDGVFTVAERGSSLVLGGVCLLLSALLATYATLRYAKPEKKDFLVTSQVQRKKLIDALCSTLSDDLPIKPTQRARGKLVYEGEFTFFWGLTETVRITDEKTGLHVEAPKKLMDIITATANEVLLHSV